MAQNEYGPGSEPAKLSWKTVAEAKRLMRPRGGSVGLDLYQAAHLLNVRPRDLDVALWRHIGTGGW
jgi:hypothetical protein